MFGVAHGEQPNFFSCKVSEILISYLISVQSELGLKKSYFLVLSCFFILMLPSPIWILGLLHVSQLVVVVMSEWLMVGCLSMWNSKFHMTLVSTVVLNHLQWGLLSGFGDHMQHKCSCSWLCKSVYAVPALLLYAALSLSPVRCDSFL